MGMRLEDELLPPGGGPPTVQTSVWDIEPITSVPNSTLTFTSNPGTTFEKTVMTLTDAGDAGIGTTSPRSSLHIAETGPAEITAEGDTSGFINAAVSLQANNATVNFRGLGTFMYDAAGKTEWYAGRPYGGGA